MEPAVNKTDIAVSTGTEAPGMESACEKPRRKPDPLFPFMGIGSLVYAFFYTVFLYKNASGITFPFFAGGTCFFFFLYLRKSGITAAKVSLFPVVSIILLGISTFMTDSWILIFLNRVGIFFLFFYLVIHTLYQDRQWDIARYLGSILNIVCTSLVFVFRPFTDFSDYLKNKKKIKNCVEAVEKGKYILFGIILAVPLLSVILLLLYDADAVFSHAINRIFSFDIKWNFQTMEILFLFLFVFFATYSILCRLSVHDLKEEMGDHRKLEPIMGLTFTGLVSLVYLVFCYIQIIYLFGGFGRLPENYTYASYAREGFFQLVFVCLINLMLVLGCLKYFRESRALKGILTFISVCTYIMIASSAYRMLLYIQAFNLTFLRVFVLWTLCVIFLLMSGALIMIYRESFPYARYCITVVTVFYLFFSFSRPDYWIARYNLSQDTTDYYYLKGLSLDAAPAIFDHYAKTGFDEEETIWFSDYASHMIIKSYDFQTKKLDQIWQEAGKCLPRRPSFRCLNLSRWTAYRAYEQFYQLNPDFAEDVEYNIMCYTGNRLGRP